MVKRNFEQELNFAFAYNSLSHSVSERILCTKQKLPIPPEIGARPFINMKLSWGNNPEINVSFMVDPGANVLVLL